MILMLALGPLMLSGLGGKGEALAQAVAYSEVAFFGSVFVWIVNTLASVSRVKGITCTVGLPRDFCIQSQSL